MPSKSEVSKPTKKAPKNEREMVTVVFQDSGDSMVAFQYRLRRLLKYAGRVCDLDCETYAPGNLIQ